ncbi:MAG: BlaI/MecI/CopY family transcriptional regulator [Planctomycetota bacterium]
MTSSEPNDTPADAPLRLGDLQLAILRVLWSEGEATVVRVHQTVSRDRGGSASTIATMLTKMEARGLVAHRKEGRQFVWRSLVAEEQARRSMVRDVTARMFGGDPLELLNHLVHESEIDRGDLDALRALIERRAAAEGAAEGEGTA